MSDIPAIHDRFVECPGFEANQSDPRRDGWIHIRDRATDQVISIIGESRAQALWILRALNAADKSLDEVAA